MHLEAPPEDQPASENGLESQTSVSLQQMVEGELLSLSQEELKAELQAGEDMAKAVFERAGLTPDMYSPDILAQWASVDPNILTHFSVDHLSPEDKVRLSMLLQGVVGVHGASYCIGNETHTVHAPSFKFPPAVRALLQKRVCEEDHDDASYTWYQLRRDMLTAVMKNEPDRAEELIEILEARGLQNIVSDAERDSSPYSFSMIDEVRHSIPYEGTPEEIRALLEEQEQAAIRYDKFRRKRGPFRNPFDAEGDDEEEELNVPFASSVASILTEKIDSMHPSPNYECRWSASFMIAAVRFAEGHPESLIKSYETTDDETGEKTRKSYDNSPAFLSNLMASAEQLPAESVPDEVIRFIADKVTVLEKNNRSQLRPWPWLASSSDPLADLQRYFASGADQRTVEGALSAAAKKRKDLTKIPQEEDGKTVYYQKDARAVRALAEWIRTHQPWSINSRKSFDDALRWIEDRALSGSSEDPSASNYQFMVARDGGGRGWSTTRWSTATGVGSALLQLCLQRLPLEDVEELCQIYSPDWVDTGLHAQALSMKVKTTDDVWRLWKKLQSLGLSEHVLVLMDFPHIFRSAFQEDLPRACTALRKDVLEPLIEAGSVDSFLYCLDLYARLDREEAKTMMLQAVERPEFCEMLKRRPLYENEVVPALIRVCYGSLTYPSLKDHSYLELAEKPGSTLPSPMAMMLNFEAKGGTPWFSRTVPVLNPKAVEDAWWRMVHDQEYVDQVPQSGSGSTESREGGKSPEQTYADRRNQLLDNPDQTSNGMDDPDGPELPQSPNQQEKPRTIGTLSRPLTGDNRYLAAKICDRFNERWSAHDSAGREACIALRDLIQQPSVGSGEPVTLEARMNHGAVVPVPLASETTDMSTTHGRFRWASHWSRRLDSPGEAADVSIQYLAGEDRFAGDATLDEVLHALPQPLKTHLGSLSDMNDLPPKLQAMLRQIDVRAKPLSLVVEEVRQIVLEYYEYCFLLQHPEYAQKYRELLTNMPYTGDRNAYLDFIHSLREEHEKCLGRGVCGQLSTVLQASLRSIGIPAYFATGYFADGTTITTNDGHAWVIVPMLDAEGRLFVKPVESTGGAAAEELALRNAEAFSRPGEPEDEERSATAEKAPDTTPEQTNDLQQYYRDRLGLALTASDLASAAGVVRKTVLEDRQSRSGEQVTVTDTAALMPDGYLVTPRLADRVEAEIDDEAQHLSEGTRAILRHLLTEGREKYAEINARFMEGTTLDSDDEWWAPRDSNP